MPASNVFATKPYLIDISLQKEQVDDWDAYPFSMPAVRCLDTMTFHPDVTFLIGENGAGKSTLLEAIAELVGYNPEGGNRNTRFSTRASHSNLSGYLKARRGTKKPADGYFLRAESFYNLATYMEEVEYLGGFGGRSLHEQSHGESFMALLTKKLRGKGLYLLDEPEAALSPSRQLSALAAIHSLVRNESQFIIATHSPILMAYPNAKIYLLSETGIREVAYEETEHYQIARDFLTHREEMLRVLLEE